jgi:hypothetical protein
MLADHSLVGTPGYQAPEFLKGDQPQEGGTAALLQQLSPRAFLKTATAFVNSCSVTSCYVSNKLERGVIKKAIVYRYEKTAFIQVVGKKLVR